MNEGGSSTFMAIEPILEHILFLLGSSFWDVMRFLFEIIYLSQNKHSSVTAIIDL
ncbi:hypothetical protein R3W88_002474 [Solanum pinnatisectum]|uniref:Uncharacterized protein n=1 Tax=Solanum pinnatisectum TaxID=50273 RepID=A0AAV9MQ21_9SOLN|nr:hypothetical protein R3W88_002474 [Solanum pinnatisectum]